MGQYECLDDYVADWGDMADFYDSVIESGSIGGKVYGIPYTPDARMFAINTELFEKAGLNPDNPPSTWEELKEAHEKLLVKINREMLHSADLDFPPAVQTSISICKSLQCKMGLRIWWMSQTIKFYSMNRKQ